MESLIKNPANEPDYWDEGNKHNYPWYKKKFWKRALRKKWIKERLKDSLKD